MKFFAPLLQKVRLKCQSRHDKSPISKQKVLEYRLRSAGDTRKLWNTLAISEPFEIQSSYFSPNYHAVGLARTVNEHCARLHS